MRIPIFGLSSFEIVAVLTLSCLASFLLFFSVIPEIFFVSLVDFWRPPNHVYYSRRTHYATSVIQHVPRLSNTDHNTKETNPKVCKHIVFTSLIGLQHVTFILKIKSYICVTLKEQNSQINMFNKRNLYNITNCILQRFTL